MRQGCSAPVFKTIARAAGLLLLLPLAPLRAIADGCQLMRLAELPITMSNLRPLMDAKINGKEVRFLVDSGLFFSVISPASAAELGLATSPAAPGAFLVGVGGGTARMSITRVKEFVLTGVPLRNVDFIVGGSDAGGGTVGVLGQNVLHIGNAVEYDLGQGVVRLFRAKSCEKARLAYWVDANTQYSAIAIPRTDSAHPFAIASAEVNGKPIRVEFDSGATMSVLSLRAAARAGVTPDSPGAVYAGESAGFGKVMLRTYIAPFSSFKIGGEEIRNTKLRIADIDLTDADMLVGADFFLSHRIMVANSQQTLYFTYNGGPVFNLDAIRSSSSPADPSSASAPGAGAPSTSEAPQASDADELARRAGAEDSRHQLDQALADINRACELKPDDPEYLYQRAALRLEMSRPDEALADLNHVLSLKPDHIPALILRARLSWRAHDRTAVGADLGAASAAASKESDLRLAIAQTYEQSGFLDEAIREEDRWIDAHPDDVRVPAALDLRCRARALEGTDLDRALKDCDTALRRTDARTDLHWSAMDSRGLVYLKLGKYEKSIADYDAVLKDHPKDAWAWYGRGVDKLRLNRTAEGKADIAQATALAPKDVDELRRRGITD
jgi:tetratricopeptide (TPR) repeat protein/predicted aspartyl protease